MAFDSALLVNDNRQYEVAYWNKKADKTNSTFIQVENIDRRFKEYRQFTRGIQQQHITYLIKTDYNYDYNIHEYIFYRDEWFMIEKCERSYAELNKAALEYNNLQDNRMTYMVLVKINIQTKLNNEYKEAPKYVN